MSKKSTKTKCARLFARLTGRYLRTLVITAGFPYHKSPHLYQWMWVFILLPFLEEETLNELSGKHGRKIRELYRILMRYPKAFEKLLRLLALPVFFELLRDFDASGDTAKSRTRIMLIIDDTKSEKFGSCMEFIHKLFDHVGKRYIMGYNYVLMLAVSAGTVFPLSFVLWLPSGHPDHRSKNDITRDEIILLKKECGRRGLSLGETEITFDSAFCRQKVVRAAEAAGLRIVSKPSNTHKFEFEDGLLTPKEIVGKVKDRAWKYLEAGHCYHRVTARHRVYGSVVLIIRRRELKNGKVIHDVLMCNRGFYNALRIHRCYKKRWEIEMHFKYYKQYLSLGRSQFQKLGSIRSHLSCVAVAGLVVALFRRQSARKISFRQAVRLIARELHGG